MVEPTDLGAWLVSGAFFIISMCVLFYGECKDRKRQKRLDSGEVIEFNFKTKDV